MTVNQKIREELESIKNGFIRVSEELSVSKQAVSNKLADGKPQIDSLKWLLAICKVTEKELNYYISEEPEYQNLLSEPTSEYGMSKKELIEDNKRLKEENSRLKDKLLELRDRLDELK